MAERVCPVWVGYLLLSPLRRLFENPYKLMRPHVKPGMTVLDVGCAMGYFSLPAAKLVGPAGRVVCLDLQPKMIEVLRRRAGRAGLLNRMDLRVCPETHLRVDDLNGRVDVVLAFHVIHELPPAHTFFKEVAAALKPGGKLLVVEPKGHVSNAEFARAKEATVAAGLVVIDETRVRSGRAFVAVK